MTAALRLVFWGFLWIVGPQSTMSSVEGILVRAGTTQPLPDETVGLWPTTRTIRTGVDGRFLFRDVPSGQYLLTFVREGMKVQLPVSIIGNQPARGLTLEVKSAPAITGTVFHPTGERAAATRVQAYRTVHTPLGPRVQSVMSVVTDDVGEFRLFRLRHGEYHLSAGYSDRERRVVTQGLRLTPNLSKADDGLPTIFYSDEYTLFQSQKVRLNRDTDSIGTHIFLKDGPRYSLDVKLIPEGVCARVAVVAEGAYVTKDDFANNVCGSTRLTGLSEGTYLLLAMNDLMASDVVRVTTVNLSTEVKVVLQPTVNIPGRVTGNVSLGRGGPGGRGLPPVLGLPGGRGSPPGTTSDINVRLSRHALEISQDLDVPVAADGSFTISGVGPGSYDISIQPLPGLAYVRSLAYGSFDALFTPITINNATPVNRLTIELAQSNTTAQGIVVDRAGRPVPGADVVLVPRGNRRRPDRYLATTADVAGNFRFAGIPPMDYAVLAFEDIEPQGYFVFVHDTEAFNRYTVTAQTLSSGASNNQLRLVAIPAEETAGGIR